MRVALAEDSEIDTRSGVFRRASAESEAMLPSFKEIYYGVDALDEIIVEVSETELPKELLTEGGWVSSGKDGWMYRVDPARPEMHQRRHVHIAKEKHTGTKNKQASWNDNKTRHDKKTFNTSVGGLNVVQDIARQVLSLPNDAVLEEFKPSGPQLLTEATSREPGAQVVWLALA